MLQVKKLIRIGMLAAATAVLSSAAVAQQTIWGTDAGQVQAAYDARYGTATQALSQVFGNAAAAGKQVRNGQSVGIEAPRVVVHAATVDEPVRGRGDTAAFVRYLSQRDVRQWYMANFGLR